MKAVIYLISAIVCMPGLARDEDKAPRPKPAPIPVYSPARAPVATGEVPVGLIVVAFKETAMPNDFSQAMKSLGKIKGISQQEYFKIYSNGIAWPAIHVMPSVGTLYHAPQFYGYYCEYDYWKNPLGWTSLAEGNTRASRLKKEALEFASKTYRGVKPRFICYNYLTTRPETAAKEITAELVALYENRRGGSTGKIRPRTPRQATPKDPARPAFDPWAYYSPGCRWGDPLWPNSSIQINDFSASTFAHELGHALGAPDVYHLGRYQDGIAHDASLLAYGPTANAFSRFYHHAYIKEQNHPTIKTSGTYTLYPRHLDPPGDEALGYLIPSSHPHYLYQVEYIHDENDTVGVGVNREGMLISVVNLGLKSYLGSPDYFYVYRPNDPFFRGLGDTTDCLFGQVHRRTEFNLATEPSSRLPNLLDGGVAFKNIQEHDGTLTFDVVIDRKPITGAAYTNSMLPQIRLDEIQDLQATSFTLNCTIKFRGEPLKTAYGFCWSTHQNPTVNDHTYALAHRECYRGHAINLLPNTTYYVRAFATNGLGVRYSDEEQAVKTLDPRTPPTSIGPLCTDSFSANAYLFSNFSNETEASGGTFIGYSPTCVLAKLIAYHRPAKFSITSADSKTKTAPVNFNNLSWRPGWEDFPMRLEEVRRFFGAIYRQSRQLGLHAPKPDKNFIRNLVQLTGVSGKPVLTAFTADNTQEAVALIRKDLSQSRPVILVFAYDVEGITAPIRWAMIDGINSKGELRVDFPLHTAFGDTKPKSGYHSPAALMFPFYKASIVTSLHY
ncbi:MAG: hypothetical protein NTW21_21160 [Verrucomicrobia bacterium]|nr:hypothetical protein [Verrucomicrobiota bacterium]